MKRQAQITYHFWLTQGTWFWKPFLWHECTRDSRLVSRLWILRLFVSLSLRERKKTSQIGLKSPPTSFWHISWRYQEANGCSDGLWTSASVTLALIPAMISHCALRKLPVQDIIQRGLFLDVYLEPCKNRILNLMPSRLSDYLWIHLYLGHDFGLIHVVFLLLYIYIILYLVCMLLHVKITIKFCIYLIFFITFCTLVHVVLKKT